jgi:hypothetical protein
VKEHGMDYLVGNPSERARRDSDRAALESSKDLANAFNWSYLFTHGQIVIRFDEAPPWIVFPPR